MTKREINRAIRHTGLTIQGQRGAGYFYFIDANTEEQAGEMVCVCYLNQQSLASWVRDAEDARVALAADWAHC
tara:strand:+ start:2295 stop:2513 length:219 start_codon:yes stop_codon:yes gene_type:complete